MIVIPFKEFLELIEVRSDLPNRNALPGRYQEPITEKQAQYLRKMGIGTTGLKYKGQASIVIRYALNRKDKGLATPGQLRELVKLGYRNVKTISYTDAKYYIGNSHLL